MTDNITVEPHRILFKGEGARGIIHNDLWDVDETDKLFFTENFEHVTDFALAYPDEDWYQGVSAVSVIRRKSDDRLFGYPYWTSISKHSEPYIEANGYDFGFENDEVYVWTPVKAFNITGYQIEEEA